MRVSTSLVVAAAALGVSYLSALLGARLATVFFPYFSLQDIPDLSGQTALVTGVSLGGIGHITALQLCRRGAQVVLAGRDEDKVRLSMEAIRHSFPGAKLDAVIVDLASLASVKAAAEAFLSRHERCDMLVLNAGRMMGPFALSEDGYELQFASNHLGHFLLTQLLMGSLRRASPSRVVAVSSMAHYFPFYYSLLGYPIDFSREQLTRGAEAGYEPLWAYGRSKLANVLFAQELSRRYAADGVRANSVHPGIIGTRLYDGVFEKGAGYGNLTVLSILGPRFTAWFKALVFGLIYMGVEDGAVTQLYLATSPDIETRNISGEFYMPQARRASPSMSATLQQQEALWQTSMDLVAPFLPGS